MLKPIGERLLVKVIEYETKTKSGIILNDSATKQEITKARVIEISEDIKNIDRKSNV